jgi:hypothetical protein
MVEPTAPEDSIVLFDKHINVEFFDDYSTVGLSIIRPNRKEVHLNKIDRNDKTIFYPFLKSNDDYDDPDSVAIEYAYSKEETIKIIR